MKIQELLDNPNVQNVRKEKWVNPQEYLILPPVVSVTEGKVIRGLWAKLYGYDGNAEGTYGYQNVLILSLLEDTADDWLEHTGPLAQ